MKIVFKTQKYKSFEQVTGFELLVLGGFSDKNSQLINAHWDKPTKETFNMCSHTKSFSGKAKEHIIFSNNIGQGILAFGLGQKTKHDHNNLMNCSAALFSIIKNKVETSVAIEIDSFKAKNDLPGTLEQILKSIIRTNYKFDKYLKTKKEKTITITLISKQTFTKSMLAAMKQGTLIAESINIAKSYIDEVPNKLNSETFAKTIEKDVRNHLKRVKVKILNKTQIKQEKMNLLLAVNAGSAYEPRFVHLTYTPKITTKNTKHIALVGKGLTFDTGGYNLKPSASIVEMKFDMGGAATVYGAFRAAVLLNSKNKISCVIPMTDNVVSAKAITPDSVIVARNGKSVEILNTDAEGRLILADALDYTCDQNPDLIIDAATLTGACLVALGHEICAVLGNNKKAIDNILKHGQQQGEKLWHLPILKEWHTEIKSNIADLKNMGNNRYGGTSKAACFLMQFIKNDIPWIHLDIAGVSKDQGHLPYCPKKGASGLIIQTITDLLVS